MVGMNNKKGVFLLVVSSIIILSLFSGIAIAETQPTPNTNNSTQEYIVHLENNVKINDSNSGGGKTLSEEQNEVSEHLKNLNGVAIKRTYWITNAILIDINTSSTTPTAITSHESIQRISKNTIVKPPEPPEQPITSSSTAATSNQYSETYGLRQINAPTAWDKFNVTGESINVTVIDTGVNTDHSDISLYGEAKNNYKGGWAVYNKSTTNDSTPLTPEGKSAPKPYDDDTGLYSGGHGTHVSGTATGGNNTGTHIGVAPNARLQHVLVFDDYLLGYGAKSSDVISAIQWAVANDADVISLSLGSDSRNNDYIDPINNARSQGIPVIVASGNTGEGDINNPADIESATAIGATDSTKDVTSFSSGKEYDPTQTGWYGSDANSWDNPQITPFITAPGNNIKSADSDGSGLTTKSGTSMAAPHVSGAAALLLENNPTLTPTQIELVFNKGATEPDGFSGRNVRYGYGILNVTNSLKLSNPEGYTEVKSHTIPTETTNNKSITITANITNVNIIGDSASRNITLAKNGSVVNSTTVTINSKETTEVEFTTEISNTTTGTQQYTLSAENDTLTQNTTIADKDSETIVSFVNESVNQTLVKGNNETISANVTNIGGLTGSPTLTLYANSTLVNTTQIVNLSSGESNITNITYTPSDEAKETTLKVNTSTDNDTLTKPLKPLGSININATVAESAHPNEEIHLNASYKITEGVNRTVTPVIKENDSTISSGSKTTLNASERNKTYINSTYFVPTTSKDNINFTFTSQNEYGTQENLTEKVEVEKIAVHHVNQLSLGNDNIEAKINNTGYKAGESDVYLLQNGSTVNKIEDLNLSVAEEKTTTMGLDNLSTGTSKLTVKTNTTSLSLSDVKITEEMISSNENNDNTETSNTGSGSGGGGQGGGGVGGGGSTSTDTGPETPTQIKNTLNLVEPEETKTFGDGTAEDSSDTSNPSDVESVTLTGDKSTTISVNDYGDPPEKIKNDVAESIASYNNEIGGNPSKDNGESTSESQPSNTQSKGTQDENINVISLSEISPKQEIDESETTAKVTFSIDQNRVSSPERISVYKQEYVFEAQEEQWVEKDIEIKESGGQIKITTTVNGFSLFSVVETESTQNDINQQNNNRGNEENNKTNDGVPGFTTLTGLLSIALVTLLAKKFN